MFSSAVQCSAVSGRIRVAVLGLGEAGGRLAADLAALGVSVTGFDPADSSEPVGVERAATAVGAVAGAAAVLSVNSARAAAGVAREVAGALAGVEVYADLNTGPPALKTAVAAALGPAAALLADVALLAPVPERGLATPALAAGSGADAFARLFAPLGMPVEVVPGEPGAAAERKLLRSVFTKGWAAAIGESLAAARAAGCEEWLRANIEATVAAADAVFVERLVAGSSRHAVRRVDEMDAACALLAALGVEPRVAAAAAAQLRELAAAARESPVRR